jgi:hypothetical protein
LVTRLLDENEEKKDGMKRQGKQTFKGYVTKSEARPFLDFVTGKANHYSTPRFPMNT